MTRVSRRPGDRCIWAAAPNQAALSRRGARFLWIMNPAVSTALVGCRNIAEVEDNVGAIGWSISDSDLTEIDAIFERHGVTTVPDFWIEETE